MKNQTLYNIGLLLSVAGIMLVTFSKSATANSGRPASKLPALKDIIPSVKPKLSFELE